MDIWKKYFWTHFENNRKLSIAFKTSSECSGIFILYTESSFEMIVYDNIAELSIPIKRDIYQD